MKKLFLSVFLFFLVLFVSAGTEGDEIVLKVDSEFRGAFSRDGFEFNSAEDYAGVWIMNGKKDSLRFDFRKNDFLKSFGDEKIQDSEYFSNWYSISNETPIRTRDENGELCWLLNIFNSITGHKGKRHLSYSNTMPNVPVSKRFQYDLLLSGQKAASSNSFLFSCVKEFLKTLETNLDPLEFARKDGCFYCKRGNEEYFFCEQWEKKLKVFYTKKDGVVRVLVVFKEKVGGHFIFWEIIRKDDVILHYEYASDEKIFWLDTDGDGIFDEAIKIGELKNPMFYNLEKKLIQSVEIPQDE